jgi:hypothetical protein
MYAVLTSFLADAESELKHANAIDANAIFVIFISFSVLFCFVLSAPSVMQDLSLSQIGLQQFICRFVPESPYRFILDLAYSFPGSNEEIGAFCKKNYGVTFPKGLPLRTW